MKDVKGFEGLYAVTEDGQVWSYRRHKFLKPYITDNGYAAVKLSLNNKQTNFRINRLVAIAYIENDDPNKIHVGHLDENKLNNTVSNLYWTTIKDNNNYGTRTDNMKKSLLQFFTKNYIITCVETGEQFKTYADAARSVGVGYKSIMGAIKRHGRSGGYHWEVKEMLKEQKDGE